MKLSTIGICALSLSGCAVTKSVAQGVYDQKADEECRITSGQDGSIHRTAKSNCVGSSYVSKDKVKKPDEQYKLDLIDADN